MLKSALKTFSDTRAAQAATSLAYYAIFSLFPLLLAFIAGGSYFLDDEQVFQSVIRFLQRVLPITLDVIVYNLQEVLDARGAVGTIGLLTFLWSASGFFTNLAYNINQAWPNAPRRSFLRRRLVGLVMILGLLGLLILSLILDWVTGLIPILNNEGGSPPYLILWSIISNLGSWLTIFLLFMALYRWVPVAKVRWTANFWGALISSILWRLATAGFGWYLQSGWGRYQLVYGSLGAIVAFLFLIYILSLITLFGAHLSSTIDSWESKSRTKKGAT